ncbi:MAG: triose-phosphate isomerase [Candidatus Aerophobetes bacterium]|nr:triose-phosphate isomerase [Candidatus Aerophobetes bacterium]
MRKPIIGGNWKMNKTLGEAIHLVEELKGEIGNKTGKVEVVIFPPFTLLRVLQPLLKETEIGLGAQNMYWEREGAYTGEISALMLLDAGCSYVILGHSERREYFKETDEKINKKLITALSFGLTPIVCVGEKLEERKRGEAEEIVEKQLRRCLKGISSENVEKVVIAYEPVWAIGTGETATPDEAQEMHYFIREKLKSLWKDKAELIRIQYGGSVKPENIKELMRQSDIDGALVGGASLRADSFAKIIKYKE